MIDFRIGLRNVSLHPFLALLLFCGAYGQDEPLQVKVAVTASLIPVFAVDAQGKPVLDLKKEELELRVNGRSVDISNFYRVGFQVDSEVQKKEPAQPTAPKPPLRLVFLIIDSVFNSQSGVSRAVQIARRFVGDAPPGQAFVLLANHLEKGIVPISGPELDKAKIVAKLDALKLTPSSQSLIHQFNRDSRGGLGVDYQRPSVFGELSQVEVRNLEEVQKAEIEVFLQKVIPRYISAFANLRYALATIKIPKVAFLFSEGIPSALFAERVNPHPEDNVYEPSLSKPGQQGVPIESQSAEYDQRVELGSSNLYDLYRLVSNYFSSSGCLLHIINSGRPKSKSDKSSGELGLRYLATESGGSYFSGVNSDLITSELESRMSAYYELAFTAPEGKERRLEITLRCTRPGVEITSLRQTMRRKTYSQMNKTEREMYALNLAVSGMGALLDPGSGPAQFAIVKQAKEGDALVIDIDVTLPEKLQYCEADIYCIRLNPKTRQSVILQKRLTTEEVLPVRLDKLADERIFFVCAEAFSGASIMAEVK